MGYMKDATCKNERILIINALLNTYTYKYNNQINTYCIYHANLPED